MKLLTKNTDYAVRALLSLGQSTEEYISAREIAGDQNIPYQYLRKILQVLINKELVISKEGVGGGYKGTENILKTKVSDVIRMFQGDIKLSECMFRKKICENRNSCVLRKNIMNIEKKVEKEFGKITIKSLLKEAGAKNEKKHNKNRRRKM